MRSLLIIDNDTVVTEPLTYLLEQAGFRVTVATSAPEAFTEYESIRPQMVLLEWQLPGMSGLEVCATLRSRSAVPIIVLTAAGEEVDEVAALEVGADDYLNKPFSVRELTARIDAVLRRYEAAQSGPAATVLTAGPVQMDLDRHRALVNGIETHFRLKDFTVLDPNSCELRDRSAQYAAAGGHRTARTMNDTAPAARQ